jgi:hypothetical protein
MTWTAEITNDPSSDYDLYIELLENHEYRGRIERQGARLVLRLYSPEAAVPVEWLIGILEQAAKDVA